MNSPGRHDQDARAKVTGAGDVVGSIADHDELFRLKICAEMLIDSLRGQRRQVAAIERIVTERARQAKELRQTGDLDFQVRCWFYVAGEQG